MTSARHAFCFVITLLLGLLSLSACKAKQCNPENCDTCCTAEGACVLAVSKLACGAQGSSCNTCEPAQACVSGACQNIGPDPAVSCSTQARCTLLDGTCGAECRNGCCDSAGTCHASGLEDSACGNRARACDACTNAETCTQVMDGGTCVLAVSDVFKPCTSDSDCSALTNGICKKTTSSGNAPYEGGYCTHLCGRTGLPICPGDSECVGGAGSFGEDDAFCWKSCDTDLECRGGENYLCYWSGAQNLGCWLKPRPAPADVPGSACTSNAQCGPPPDFNPVCVPATLSDGGASGFTDGACLSDCGFTGQQQCGPSGVCVEFDAQNIWCQRACTTVNLGDGEGDSADGGCRSGYLCRALSNGDGGTAPTGFCDPSCKAAYGAPGETLGCPSGYTCENSGRCCADAGCF